MASAGVLLTRWLVCEDAYPRRWCSKREEVETAGFQRPEPGSTPRLPLCSMGEQSQRADCRTREHGALALRGGRSVNSFGAMLPNCCHDRGHCCSLLIRLICLKGRIVLGLGDSDVISVQILFSSTNVFLHH